MGSCFFCKRKKEFCPYSGIGMITDEKDNVFGGGSDLRWELGSGTGSGINSPSLRTRWFQVALPKERAANSGEPVDDAGVPRTLHRPTHIAPFADRCCVGATDSWELADVMGSRVHQPHPTHIMPTVTRHGVGAANSLKSAVGHGSATHQSEGMLVALRHSPSPLKGEPPKPTHTGPIVSLPRMGAADSVKA